MKQKELGVKIKLASALCHMMPLNKDQVSLLNFDLQANDPSL
jgi:hypothetical protein